MKFDDILDEIGEFGWYQKCVIFLLFVPSAFLSMQDMGYIFTSAIPKYRCFVDGCDSNSTAYYEPFLNFTTPYETSDDNAIEYSECQLYSSSNASGFNSFATCRNDSFDHSKTVDCYVWKYDNYDYESTVVTQWNLVCDDSNQVALSQSIYMLGTMIGAIIIGAIADNYGRKMILLISIFLTFATGISSAYVPYYPLFLTLRFFLGAASQGAYIVILVMSVEFVGKNHRGQSGMLMSVVYSIGELIFGAIAYAIRDWQLLQLVISIPLVIFLVYYWLIPESPRWLLANEKEKAAKKILERIAKSNGKTLTDDMLTNYQPDEQSKDKESLNQIENEKVTWSDLFRTSYMRLVTLNLCFSWFMITIAYYGITMSSPTVGGNAYVNFIIVCSVEIPAYICGMLAMDKFGRRYPLCLFMIVGGIAGICTGVVPSTSEYSWLTITLATIGKFGAASAFGIIYVFTVELYPTAIRNNGLAVSSFIGHIGGVVAPYIAALDFVNEYLPLVIFGICSLASGLTSLTLPETLGTKLPETIEDSKQMKMCACFSRTNNSSRAAKIHNQVRNDEDGDAR